MTQQHLQALIAEGATITDTTGYRWILANAAMTENALWFFEAFGEDQTAEHVIEFHQAKANGANIDILDADGHILATIAPIETPEDAVSWQTWKALLASDRSYPEFICRLKNQAMEAASQQIHRTSFPKGETKGGTRK